MEGAVYIVPHTITKSVPEDDKEQHTEAQEMTGTEKDDAIQYEENLIRTMGWKPEQISQTSDPTRKYDCHGLTLDDGRSFIDNKYAEDIARFYGYKPISECHPVSDPKEGDIVIYRKNGKITHSGRIIGRRGAIIRVHSKWGRGPDYEHDIDVVPDTYGQPEVWRKCP